ncbi:MAG: hypothetical protein LBL58_13595 [Tannerellaceae bacterium]|nr:hypothetical protein [Tannerellaceae bacterium]
MGRRLLSLPREVSQTCGSITEAWSKVSCEKSVEVIVPDYELIWEGLNYAVKK